MHEQSLLKKKNHHNLEREGNTQLLLRTRHRDIACWPKAFALKSACLLL